MTLTTPQFAPLIRTDNSVIILAGETVSSAVDLLGTVLVGILTEDALDVASSMTFQSSNNGVSFFPAHTDIGVPLSVAVQPNRHIVLGFNDFAAIRFIKLVLDAAEAADVTFTLTTRPSL